MGEIAEMMINGLMCSGCGEFMGDFDEPGFARYCCGCARHERQFSKQPARTMPPMFTPEQIAARDQKRAEKNRAKRQRKKAHQRAARQAAQAVKP